MITYFQNMQLPDISKITVDKIQSPSFSKKGIELEILRLDKIHPIISGNKWFKLKYHLENYHKGSYKGILTFGGNWSNHIVAAACACFQQKIPSIGIIRGEKPAKLSYSLQQAMNFNMKLEFISRELYKQKSKNEFIQKIKTEYPGFYIIPEGGAGVEGEKGAGEIMNLVNNQAYTHIACAVGTATMFNGISKAISPNQQVMGIVILKGWEELVHESSKNIFCDYHFGGYARYNPLLIEFMNNFYRQTEIPTDFVYTGKMVFAIYDLLKKDYFPDGSKILMIHSGGLQGNASLPEGKLIFLLLRPASLSLLCLNK